MLKRVDPGPDGSDWSIGELIGQLIDDVKAYARAEVGLLQVRAGCHVDRFRRAAILFGLAAALGLAALVAVPVTLVIGLARWIGPFGGGGIAILLFAGGAFFAVRAGLNSIERKDD